MREGRAHASVLEGALAHSCRLDHTSALIGSL
jgi:hypothetical protein